jgi:hypothetical protein
VVALHAANAKHQIELQRERRIVASRNPLVVSFSPSVPAYGFFGALLGRTVEGPYAGSCSIKSRVLRRRRTEITKANGTGVRANSRHLAPVARSLDPTHVRGS